MADEHAPLSVRNQWRIDALDRWRDEWGKELDRRVAVLESEVHTIMETRKLDEALAKANREQLHERQTRHEVRLTKAQTLGGVLVGLVAVADLVRGLIS